MMAELRITPVGSGIEFARLVGEAVKIVSESSLHYQVHAMGTTLEGGLAEILEVVRHCHEALRKHADRVLIELSIDDRAGAEGELVRSVEHLRERFVGVPLERLVTERVG